jgi:deoxyribonuclease-1
MSKKNITSQTSSERKPARSNFAYDELHRLSPESNPRHQCGKVLNARFKPSFGKGAIARAMFYFLITFP